MALPTRIRALSLDVKSFGLSGENAQIQPTGPHLPGKQRYRMVHVCLCVINARFSNRRSVNLPRVASFRDGSAFSTDSHLVCERMGVMAAFTSFQHFTQYARFLAEFLYFNF